MLPDRVYLDRDQYGGDSIMNEVREYLLRLCVGGICCTAAVNLSGAGAKREIARFVSTCIMLLLCISGIKEINFTALENYMDYDLQGVVDSALQDEQQLQKLQVDEALEQYIEEQASNLGCICRVRVSSVLDQGEYQLQIVRIATNGAVAHEALQNWMISTLKVKETQIRWEDNSEVKDESKTT